MSIPVNPLFHWAPKRFRVEILRDGLKIMSPCRHQEDDQVVAFPWICLGTTPSTAWGLILDPEPEYVEFDGAGWDLWQVNIREGDQLTIRGDFAPFVREVRVQNGLPADRCWWVAERQGEPHEGLAGE